MFLTLDNRGTIEHPRYALMNSYGWCWDDEVGEFVDGDGTLYHDVNPACKKMQEILLADHGDKQVRRFRAPIYLELFSDDEIDQAAIEDWCLKATRLILHSDQYGIGPVNDSLGLVTINWGQMEELGSDDRPGTWSRRDRSGS